MVSRSRSPIDGLVNAGDACATRRLVVEPAVPAAIERHEVTHVRQARPNRIDGVQVVAVGAHHRGAAVLDEVAELLGDQPVVDRHEHGPELRDRVERRQQRVRIRSDVGDPIALPHAQRLEDRRPPIAALAEGVVGPAQGAIHHRLSAGIQAPGAAHELERRQRRFHRRGDSTSLSAGRGSAAACDRTRAAATAARSAAGRPSASSGRPRSSRSRVPYRSSRAESGP